MGYDHRSVEMSVVVQKMVRPISAGVAFTLNPADGDRSTVAIDSAWGFGESVVSGIAEAPCGIADALHVTIGDDHRRSCDGKGPCRRQADSCSSASNERNPSVKC